MCGVAQRADSCDRATNNRRIVVNEVVVVLVSGCSGCMRGCTLPDGVGSAVGPRCIKDLLAIPATESTTVLKRLRRCYTNKQILVLASGPIT